MQRLEEPVKGIVIPSVDFYFDFGCPTYFVGDGMYSGKDRLHDVEEEIVRRKPA